MTTSPALTFEWLEEIHADVLYDGFSDLQVSQFTAEKLPGSLADVRREFAEFHAGAPPDRQEIWMNWVIRETRSQELVGTLQATVFADGALWIGYKLIRSAWGRGIATAAVQWLLGELAPPVSRSWRRRIPAIMPRCGCSRNVALPMCAPNLRKSVVSRPWITSTDSCCR
jgi:hypothetical protein